MERDWRISVGGTSHVRSIFYGMMVSKARRGETVASRNPLETCTKGRCFEGVVASQNGLEMSDTD
jgi:hypothetical protein